MQLSLMYTTTQKNERLRLNCPIFTSGTAVTTLSDAEKVVEEFKDEFGNVLVSLSQDAGMIHTLPETHTGIETHTGAETHTGVETHTGNETHTGAETHTGRETHVRFDAVQVPEMYTVAAPETMTTSATMTAAQQIARLIDATPSSAAASYTTRTGTEIEAALPGTVATGD